VLKARWSPILAVALLHVVCIRVFTEDAQRCTAFVLPRPPANRAIFFPPRKMSLRPQLRQQQFVRLLSQQSTDAQGTDTDSIKAIEEAKALRRKARALAAEAEAAESKLRNETLSRKNQVDAELDVFIDDLVAVTSANLTGIDESASSGRAIDEDLIEQRRTNAILNRLQSCDSMPTTRLLRVVERIHERERLAGDGVDWDRLSATAGNCSEEVMHKMALGAGLGGLAHSLIEAVSLLEEERSTIADSSIDAAETSNRIISLKKEGPRRRFGIASDAAPKLRARMKELRRADEEVFNRKFASLANMMRRGVRMVNGTERAISIGNVTESQRNSNAARLVENMIDVPLWLPNSIMPFVVLSDEELSKNDTKKIREEVLSGSLFFCTGWETQKYAALFRGNFAERRKPGNAAFPVVAAVPPLKVQVNMSGIERDLEHNRISFEAFADVQERLAASGLCDRIQLFLLQDPEDETDNEAEAKPAILAIPSKVKPDKRTDHQLFAKCVLVASTIYTTFSYAVSVYALNVGGFFDTLVKRKNLLVLRPCLSFFCGIFSLVSVYEAARYLMAMRCGMLLAPPIPLPSLRFGTLGCKTSLRSFPKTRTHLMDMALSGPVVTMMLSILLVYCGLHMTVNATPHSLMRMPAVPSGVVGKSSFLVSMLVMKVCPKLLLLPLSQPVPIHPSVLIGMTGLIFAAINILPIGRLDGGRAFLAAFGRRRANLASFLTLLILFISALGGSTTVSGFCALLVLLYQRKAEIPVTNELTGVNPLRVWILTLLLTAAGAILAPFPAGFGAL